MNEILSSEQFQEDQDFDLSLRPQRLDDFVGQEKIKDNLAIFIQATMEREEALSFDYFFLSCLLFLSSPSLECVGCRTSVVLPQWI